ncbi:uncharacterized protein LOC6557077 [Drosophila grimshawi]|uniref:GH15330 n=1 Tax=Drosophila grimshawi TaxID=7222 RepID=B4J3M0_DROGR|nr:uncharacterized protein LOC6557077 [Drosophila grimshawi]EDV96222.1 GH15330 [Drosophila grimshawi]
MLSLLLLLIGIGILGPGCQADCNVCSAITNIACLSETQFAFCENNVPLKQILSCPSGTYCTAGPQICHKNCALQSCNACGRCNEQRTFACLGVRTFALCLGTSNVSLITGHCLPNYVCNYQDPNICSSEIGFPATCPLANDELLTTKAPETLQDPNTYCKAIRQAGRFPYGNSLNTTCRYYIQCYASRFVWYGSLLRCPGETYYDPMLRTCTTNIPATCQLRIMDLQIENLRLL